MNCEKTFSCIDFIVERLSRSRSSCLIKGNHKNLALKIGEMVIKPSRGMVIVADHGYDHGEEFLLERYFAFTDNEYLDYGVFRFDLDQRPKDYFCQVISSLQGTGKIKIAIITDFFLFYNWTLRFQAEKGRENEIKRNIKRFKDMVETFDISPIVIAYPHPTASDAFTKERQKILATILEKYADCILQSNSDGKLVQIGLKCKGTSGVLKNKINLDDFSLPDFITKNI
ncbi:MAG: hypothetical protein HQK51_21195 [Oligoflexia bacterium]|nr:hypothetical protein [Oligoflexia bacterium]